MTPDDRARTSVVVAPEELDVATVGAFASAIADAFESAPGFVVLDFGRTTFCDSTGIKVLLRAHVRARATQTALEVRSPPRNLRRMTEILGLDDLFRLPAR